MKLIPTLLFGLILLLFASWSSTADADDGFENEFWDYLIGNNYKQWAPVPGKKASYYTGQVPHGTMLKVYVNRIAAGDINGLGQGSIIVLENYLADRSLKSISVMYRTKGFNPDARDWYWIEYKPDGTVVEKLEKQPEVHVVSATEGAVGKLASPGKIRLAGKASSCIACHQKAGGGDFFFSNDQLGTNTAKRLEVSPKAVSLK